MCNFGYQDDVRHIFIRLQILILPSLFIYKSILYIKQNYGQYTTQSCIHDHNINYLFRLECSKNASNFHSLKSYNKLPRCLKGLPFNSFKAKLKNFLLTISCAFYNVDEYLKLEMLCGTFCKNN